MLRYQINDQLKILDKTTQKQWKMFFPHRKHLGRAPPCWVTQVSHQVWHQVWHQVCRVQACSAAPFSSYPTKTNRITKRKAKDPPLPSLPTSSGPHEKMATSAHCGSVYTTKEVSAWIKG